MNSTHIKSSPNMRELTLFIIVTLLTGLAAMFDSIFNNFLDINFILTGFRRSFLEFSLEVLGFLVFLSLQPYGSSAGAVWVVFLFY